MVSPLISIAQFSQVLLNHDLGPLTDRQEDLLGRMRISGLQAKRIIDDLRDLADVTHREVFAEEVKISVMATFIIDDLVVPATDCDGMFIIRPDLRDYGDPALVRTFLVNLLQNAWKYTDCEDRTVLEMTCERGPLRNVFHIKDNDIGCDNTHHERIFEAFEQLHSEKDFAGTGFGIATASRVTRRHAGGRGGRCGRKAAPVRAPLSRSHSSSHCRGAGNPCFRSPFQQPRHEQTEPRRQMNVFRQNNFTVGARVRRAVLLFISFGLAACEAAPNSSDFSPVFDGSGGRWVDLTHSFSESTIYWPTDTAGFQLAEQSYGIVEGGWFYASYAFSSAEHGGTHLDAPIHFAEGRLTADEIPLTGLIGPAAVVDVSEHATPDYLLTVGDLTAWEDRHGLLPNGGILLVRTGWGTRWTDRTAYLGTDIVGPDAVPELHFPGIGEEAASWLVANRGIVAVGIDTPSIDFGQSADFQSHVILYTENITGFENVANLEALPEAGSYVVALPMKIEGGSGGPLRIVAFVPRPGS